MQPTLFKEPLRRANGRFATAEQAELDRLRKRNKILEYRCEMLRRQLEVFNKIVLRREI